MVSTNHLCLISIHTNEYLYTKIYIVSMNGIVEVRPNVALELIVTNYVGSV